MWLADAGDVDLRCAIGIVRSISISGFNLSDKGRSASTKKGCRRGASCMKGQIRASFDFPR
jgi:hypothetical protein